MDKYTRGYHSSTYKQNYLIGGYRNRIFHNPWDLYEDKTDKKKDEAAGVIKKEFEKNKKKISYFEINDFSV